MNRLLLCCLLLSALPAAAQLPSPTVRHLKTGAYHDDTSYVYTLPYAGGRAFLFVQGANSAFSHKGELAYDFKMKEGSTVCAARGGVVAAARSDSRKGGLKPENLSDGNYIIIRHPDGSQAQYWHLAPGGVRVSEGDTVQQGQAIGHSGNTGYTAFPHLHFQVLDAAGREVLVRFATKRGAAYIRPGRWYKSVGPRP